MSTPLDSSALWCATLGRREDGLDAPREILRQSFLGFRAHVAQLVSTLGAELPDLTIHDITHIDALWRVAGEIAGANYPLNPAEAYVLGGAFLLHDAAHVLAAYPDRLAEIKQSIHWQDLVAQKNQGVDPETGSLEEKATIFQVLRHLHAEQAHRLAKSSWKVGGTDGSIYLIENYSLREYYGDVIGQVAASHHWSPAKVATEFTHRRLSCPVFLLPAQWEVDVLKVALLLRTADAAHLDAGRAPWFLFALRQPQGISADHWRFQAKLGQPSSTLAGELRFTSGSAFAPEERAAWWLALDTARMVHRELQSASAILKEEGRKPFFVDRILGVESADTFAKQLPVHGWEPVDVAPKISNVPQLIASLGGAALYGESYAAPLRELLQNALDAVAALRALAGTEDEEGGIHVAVRPADRGDWWLEVSDTGIGMSRYVLTNVLLDFGASLWTSDAMREELPGLAKSKFRPIGKFGIGFFSVFMLGSEVVVTTRRYEPSRGESQLNWQLRFDDGLASRPALVQPRREEALSRHGTRVAVRVSETKLEMLLDTVIRKSLFDVAFANGFDDAKKPDVDRRNNLLGYLVASLCPTSAVRITTRVDTQSLLLVVNPNDWITISDKHLLNRVGGSGDKLFPLKSEGGRIIGRIGFATESFHSYPLSIVYQAVVCGQMLGLEGVVQARQNNSDARRVKATPGGSLESWKAWAELVVGASTLLSLNQKLRLHTLLPERDLAVWITGNDEVTLEEVLDQIGSAEEVILHDGSVSREDDDEVSSERFSRSFTQTGEMICCPSLAPHESLWKFSEENVYFGDHAAFPWFLEVNPISYEARFEAALKKKWGTFETEELDDHPVGSVEGIEILRRVTRYCKA